MKSKRYDNAKSKSIYNISHKLLLSVESSKNKKKKKKFIHLKIIFIYKLYFTKIIWKNKKFNFFVFKIVLQNTNFAYFVKLFIIVMIMSYNYFVDELNDFDNFITKFKIIILRNVFDIENNWNCFFLLIRDVFIITQIE